MDQQDTTPKPENLSGMRDKWIAALESGEFPQGKGALRSDRGYCCLGVACEVYRRETGIGEWVPGDGAWVFKITGYYESAILPLSLVEVFGLKDQYGSSNDGSLGLTTKNDTGSCFAEIADLLKGDNYKAVPNES